MEQGNLLISIQKLVQEDFDRVNCGVEKIKSRLEKQDAEALENLISNIGVAENEPMSFRFN